ncbi:hypothetical protein ACFX14_028550 [Malus domestica]
MWYTRLSDYLISQGYELCHCVLNYEVLFQIARVTVYVVKTNLTKTPKELEKTALHLKMEFEMKDLGKTLLYFNLKLEHCSDGILVYQSNYTLNMSPLSVPLIVHTLYANEIIEEVMESKFPYLSSTLRFVVLSSLYLDRTSPSLLILVKMQHCAYTQPLNWY